jgi:hypothetical protein
MNAGINTWYRVPEVWLIVLLLGTMIIGSFMLLATAMRHPDELVSAPHSIASPLPPSRAQAPADNATP